MLVCKVCNEEVDPIDEPYTTIEHWNIDRRTKIGTIYFHAKCFIRVAGVEYGPSSVPEVESVDEEVSTEQYAMENLWPD